MGVTGMSRAAWKVRTIPNRRAPENRTQTLLRGLHSSGLCVLYHDLDLSVRLIENPPASWPHQAAILAAGDAAIFDPFTAERILAAKREVLSTGVARRIEVPQHRDGEELRWFELSLDRDEDPAEGVRGLFVSVLDISQAKQREAALRDLLYEVSHRSRNLLAILQSILGQTAIYVGSVDEFEEKFRGRIASLAQSQDLITQSNWQGVRLRRLAETQIAPFLEKNGVMPSLAGDDPMLTPHAALHLGLAFHELAANSAAAGVLSDGAGSIELRVAADPADWTLDWIETSPRRLLPALASGFGRTILVNVVPRALASEATYRIEDHGVFYAIRIPTTATASP